MKLRPLAHAFFGTFLSPCAPIAAQCGELLYDDQLANAKITGLLPVSEMPTNSLKPNVLGRGIERIKEVEILVISRKWIKAKVIPTAGGARDRHILYKCVCEYAHTLRATARSDNHSFASARTRYRSTSFVNRLDRLNRQNEQIFHWARALLGRPVRTLGANDLMEVGGVRLHRLAVLCVYRVNNLGQVELDPTPLAEWRTRWSAWGAFDAVAAYFLADFFQVFSE
jgi:hypothetical protein